MQNRLKPHDVAICVPRRHAERKLRMKGVRVYDGLSLDTLARLLSSHELLAVAVRSDINADFDISGPWLDGSHCGDQPPPADAVLLLTLADLPEPWQQNIPVRFKRDVTSPNGVYPAGSPAWACKNDFGEVWVSSFRSGAYSFECPIDAIERA